MDVLDKFKAEEQVIIRKLARAHLLFDITVEIDENPDFTILDAFSEEEHKLYGKFSTLYREEEIRKAEDSLPF